MIYHHYTSGMLQVQNGDLLPNPVLHMGLSKILVSFDSIAIIILVIFVPLKKNS